MNFPQKAGGWLSPLTSEYGSKGQSGVFHLVLTLCVTWISYLMSSIFHFLVCKMGIKPVWAEWLWGLNVIPPGTQ